MSFASEQSPGRLRRNRWVVKGLYALVYAAVGISSSFLNLYYHDSGFSGAQIGLINTTAPLAGVFSTLVWGMLSDRSGKNRWLLVVSSLGVILSMWGLKITHNFGLLVLYATTWGLFLSPMMSLLDSITLKLLGERRDQYGTMRVWGTVGFIITSSSMGFLVDRLGLPVLFSSYILLIVLFLVVSLALPDQVVEGRRVVFSGFTEITRQPVWIAFAGSVFIIWLSATGLMVFLNIYLKGLGSSDQLIGFTFAAAALAELPILPFSSVLLRRIGASRLVLIGFLGFALRMYFFSSLTNPAWGPVVSLLNGVSYVPFIIGGVAYASDLAPVHLKATSQGLLYAIMNLSSVFGGLFCGWLFDLTGPVRMYQTLAAACLVGLALFMWSQYGKRKMKTIESN